MRDILPVELEQATASIIANPQFKMYFGEEWINSLLIISDRYLKHPFFWILVDGRRCERIGKNLEVLYTNCTKFARIISKLKTDTDELNFHSTLSEVEVLAYYYDKESADFKVEYEPSLQGSDRVPDCKITIRGSDYFVEILTVFEDEIDTKMRAMQQEIRMLVDDFEQNPFILSIGIQERFVKEDVLSFVRFIKETISANQSLNERKNFEFSKNGIKIANLTIDGEPSRRVTKGYVGYTHSYARSINTSGRIKNKILSKVDQLPPNSRNIVVVNLAYITQDFIDLENVFLGQASFTVNLDTHETTAGRIPNGFVNHPKGKSISMIIGYVQENYATRKYYLSLSANKVIEQSFALEQF